MGQVIIVTIPHIPTELNYGAKRRIRHFYKLPRREIIILMFYMERVKPRKLRAD